MNAEEVLNHAADLIDEFGWVQKRFTHPDTGAVCVLGAVLQTVDQRVRFPDRDPGEGVLSGAWRPRGVLYGDRLMGMIREVRGSAPGRRGWREVGSAAVNRFEDWLRSRPDVIIPANYESAPGGWWNDKVCGSQGEAVAALRSAAGVGR